MELLFWSILLLVAGLALLVLEFFVPSGGVLSFLAAASILGAIVLGFLAGPSYGGIVLAVTTVVIPLLLAAAVRWWPHTPIGRLVLIARPDDPDDVLPETDAYRTLKTLIGRRGTARSRMMPSGAVAIEGRTYDAISEGMPIDPGCPVLVVDVRTNRIVVRPAPESPAVSAEQATADDILSQPIDSLGLEDIDEA